MGLLLPDAPVVTWWPGAAPEVPGTSPLGRIAQRRITDASTQADPQAALHALAASYMPGDADFAWTRLTLWRAQLAAVLDQPPYEPVTGVRRHRGDRLAVDDAARRVAPPAARRPVDVPSSRAPRPDRTASTACASSARPARSSSMRDVPGVATLRQPSQPTHDVALPRRTLRDCLADELRRLDPDELYGEVIRSGLAQLAAGVEEVTA